MVTVRAVFLFALVFFVGLNVLNSTIYFGTDFYERWQDLKRQDGADANFCQKVCRQEGAAQVFGANVQSCPQKCSRPILTWPKALRETVQNWHLCGVETPCIQALADFIGNSWKGTFTIVFVVLGLPIGLFMLHDMLAERRAAAAERRSRRRSHPSTTSIEEIYEDTGSAAFLTSGNRRSALQLEDKQSVLGRWWSNMPSLWGTGRTRVPAHLLNSPTALSVSVDTADRLHCD